MPEEEQLVERPWGGNRPGVLAEQKKATEAQLFIFGFGCAEPSLIRAGFL